MSQALYRCRLRREDRKRQTGACGEPEGDRKPRKGNEGLDIAGEPDCSNGLVGEGPRIMCWYLRHSAHSTRAALTMLAETSGAVRKSRKRFSSDD